MKQKKENFMKMISLTTFEMTSKTSTKITSMTLGSTSKTTILSLAMISERMAELMRSLKAGLTLVRSTLISTIEVGMESAPTRMALCTLGSGRTTSLRAEDSEFTQTKIFTSENSKKVKCMEKEPTQDLMEAYSWVSGKETFRTERESKLGRMDQDTKAGGRRARSQARASSAGKMARGIREIFIKMSSMERANTNG